MSAERTKRVEAILDAYVSTLPDGASIDVDALVSKHPEFADELRDSVRAWQQLLGILKPRAGADAVPDARVDGLVTRLRGRSAETESRYEVLHEIGRGGMGVVLEVRDRDLRRTHAMKVVTAVVPTRDQMDRTLGRFLEEAQITAQLEHPSIVPVYELGIDAHGRAFYTMPRVRGETLAAVFAHVRDAHAGWSIPRAIALLLKVCEAMAYAHSRRVVHRDLKPTNVMVGPYGELYVMDWGLARVFGGAEVGAASHDDALAIESDRQQVKQANADSSLATFRGDVVGTPSYMPPEQARGDLAAIGPTTDVYAAGAMLYELLTGKAPYAPSTGGAREILDRVRRGPPPRVDEVATGAPEELVAVCERAMAWDATKRYGDMPTLADDLRAYLEGRVVRAHRTGAWVELKKWVRRNRAFATALGVALLVTIVGLVAVLRSENERRKIAQAREQDSVDALARFREMADPHVVRGLIEEANRDLWPCRPDRIALMNAWLGRAEEAASRLEPHRAALARLRAEHGVESEDGAWTFPTPNETSKHGVLVRLVADLERLVDADDGVIAAVRRRVVTASAIESRSMIEPQDAWDTTIAAAAADPRYAALELAPQIGLVPLGADPASGLLEFLQIETGEPPERDADTGRFTMTDASGVVLVLLPGGTFTMGAQPDDPDGSNYDPDANASEESPPNAVTLAPFFIAKHELTRGQWQRFAGSSPSKYPLGFRLGNETVSGALPVDSISWFECRDMLARVELALPTEAQWEYAARAGTSTPWWCGAEKESLEESGNIADEKCRISAGQAGAGFETWNDGFVLPAPVGSFAPNAFGLHDVHGNLWEWCEDTFDPDAYRIAPFDDAGRRATKAGRSRAFRGGSFTLPAREARSAMRYSDLPDRSAEFLGVRPARPLLPPREAPR